MSNNQPYYSLRVVRNLVKFGSIRIDTKARLTASKDFGWQEQQIKNAILKLRHDNFYKSQAKYDNPEMMVDYYKSDNLMGERVYIHFRIEDNILVLCSFKEL